MDQLAKNLEIAGQFNNFNEWLYSKIKPYLAGDILETGSGLGIFSQRITSDFSGSNIYLSDINKEYLACLRQNFGSNNNVKIIKLDLNNLADFAALGKCKFNGIICLNVLEHVPDDMLALSELKKLLQPGGRLILLAPCHRWLYNTFDRAVLHYRRYNKQELARKLTQAGFKPEWIFYFNVFAILGWFWEGNILRRKVHSQRLFWLFDKLVPLFKFIEKYIIWHTLGISIISICKAGDE
ncbi:hypothetical protein COT99_04385 [Candidatus Falkowbacteria bacterium CG10_big_fil_rev_8_21_14_0_10_43_10]|uniref:Methyltransferase type 11 domain-containing protein n=1 Tax=Candidatus Falkowbacteria bacterium CG10_big_fil_rev_8_21_14_0_10_43_10 TaxID=1974567 RepID=A0A2H0V106_9BACT|nr:MAG: hypothetical protein COT99_04385 [Candidatus Falkowbacteria bacterium CG10_big_fil_rev_8_21_14_0_10_43_10]